MPRRYIPTVDAAPREVPEEVKVNLLKYAQQKGVNLIGMHMFDGDEVLLKEQIDRLSDLTRKYPLRRKITFEISGQLSDDDFGEKVNNTLRINKLALRNRDVTMANLQKGNKYVSNDPVEIITHEYGHFMESQYGKVDIDVIRTVLYNQNIKDESSIYLLSNVSKYAIRTEKRANGNEYYTDIASEVFVLHETSPNQFTQEFMNVWLKKGA